MGALLDKADLKAAEKTALEQFDKTRHAEIVKLAEEPKIHGVGILTSGGDAPGMNPLIRGVGRAAVFYGLKAFGIRRGFHGLTKGEIFELGARDFSETIQRGGTFLMTARSQSFQTGEGLAKAKAMLEVFKIDCVFCLGGDGTWRGAAALADQGVKIMALPATIDNDIGATDYTIGFDTAVNTAMDAIDKLRDTASSHERCSVVEVMGRNSGYIALSVGIASGAEIVLIPEHPVDFMNDVVAKIISARNRGKRHYIVIVAEGAGNSQELAKRIEEMTDIETRATNLGYIQRGGSPRLRDRYTASLMGVYAVRQAIQGNFNRAIVIKNGEITDMDIHEANACKKSISKDLVDQAGILSF